MRTCGTSPLGSALFRDRVVHHALIRVIEPVFEPKFIEDSYACRKGKGTHAGVRRCADFCGFVCYRSGRIKVRGASVRRYVKRLRLLQQAGLYQDVRASVRSWIGHVVLR